MNRIIIALLIIFSTGSVRAADPVTDSAAQLAAASQVVNLPGLLGLMLAGSIVIGFLERRRESEKNDQRETARLEMQREQHALSKKQDRTLDTYNDRLLEQSVAITRVRRAMRTEASALNEKAAQRDADLRSSIAKDIKDFGEEANRVIDSALVRGQEAAAAVLAGKYEQMRVDDDTRIRAAVEAAVSTALRTAMPVQRELYPLPPPDAGNNTPTVTDPVEGTIAAGKLNEGD